MTSQKLKAHTKITLLINTIQLYIATLSHHITSYNLSNQILKPSSNPTPASHSPQPKYSPQTKIIFNQPPFIPFTHAILLSLAHDSSPIFTFPILFPSIQIQKSHPGNQVLTLIYPFISRSTSTSPIQYIIPYRLSSFKRHSLLFYKPPYSHSTLKIKIPPIIMNPTLQTSNPQLKSPAPFFILPSFPLPPSPISSTPLSPLSPPLQTISTQSPNQIKHKQNSTTPAPAPAPATYPKSPIHYHHILQISTLPFHQTNKIPTPDFSNLDTS